MRQRWWSALLVLLGSALSLAATYPPGFFEEVAFDGLATPTAFAFAPDGRVFVAEKAGRVLVFDDSQDTTPDLLADLTVAVSGYWDRGLLGLAVDPGFPQRPYVYVLYTYDFDPLDPEAGMPRWADECPDPPGPLTDGCVANGRLARLEVGPGNSLAAPEQVLLENRWCAQYPSHTIGHLQFGPDGALYVSAGDGASFNFADYGQNGGSADSPTRANPCGDPPGGVGVALSPPDAEGGSLRAQDLRTPGDPLSFDGAILRLDPDTGEAWPGNPLAGGAADDDRVVAHGFRNPFRFDFRPGTSELWVADVGWFTWEEINRVPDPAAAPVHNFGWPCYEGATRQPDWDALDLTLCESLYADTEHPATLPYYAYRHGERVDPDPEPFRCSRYTSGSLSGLAFYPGGGYPDSYDGAMFFADYARSCLFVMFPGPDGLPDPATRSAFADGAAKPIHLTAGPDGHLYYTDIWGGRIIRIAYLGSNAPPTAVIAADRTDGPLPLEVHFNGSGSSDPDAEAVLSFAWDLDGDGEFDDSQEPAPIVTYETPAVIVVGLSVTDEHGASDATTIRITAGNTAPVAQITEPAPERLWEVGETIAFAGSVVDAEDGELPAAAFHWTVSLHHCGEPGGPCDVSVIGEFPGVSGGAFSTPPCHWPSFISIALSATDGGFPGRSEGQLEGTAVVAIQPRTVELGFDTDPPGLALAFAGEAAPTPFERTAIVGSSCPVAAPTPQAAETGSWVFFYWSHGGDQAQELVAPAEGQRYTARYLFECAAPPQCTPALRVSTSPTPAAPFGSIQAAVDAATVPGTRIEILPGSYAESVLVRGDLPLSLVALDDGTGGPVRVDGGAGPAFDLRASLGQAEVLLRELSLGGADGIVAALPTRLERLTFSDIAGAALVLDAGAHQARELSMDATVHVGVELAAGAQLSLSRSRLRGLSGTGLALRGMATLENVLLSEATTGATVEAGAVLKVDCSTVASHRDVGIDNRGGGAVTVRHSIVWGNPGGDLLDVACTEVIGSDVGSVDCSAVNDNLFEDPGLLGDYHLAASSPALDHGPGAGELPCTDLDGGVRRRDFDGDGVARLDLGAFEHANPARPAEVLGLLWTDRRTLQWQPEPSATRYHVFRGTLAELGLGWGACRDDLDGDPADTVLVDAETPAPSSGFFYLVTAEGTTGLAGSPGLETCHERGPLPACD